jgi:hypothetical protein
MWTLGSSVVSNIFGPVILHRFHKKRIGDMFLFLMMLHCRAEIFSIWLISAVIICYAPKNKLQNPIRGHVQMNSWQINESAASKILTVPFTFFLFLLLHHKHKALKCKIVKISQISIFSSIGFIFKITEKIFWLDELLYIWILNITINQSEGFMFVMQ